MTGVFFHPTASEELDESIGFYEGRQPGLGLDLEREVLHGMFQIAETPGRWPRHKHGTRRYLLHRFPFHLIQRPNKTCLKPCSELKKCRIPNIT